MNTKYLWVWVIDTTAFFFRGTSVTDTSVSRGHAELVRLVTKNGYGYKVTIDDPICSCLPVRTHPQGISPSPIACGVQGIIHHHQRLMQIWSDNVEKHSILR